MDAHELVSALKSLALDLGRTPTRREFIKGVRGGDYNLMKFFGSYVTLIQASGLETNQERQAKKAQRITNAVFEKDIEQHLEEYTPRPTLEKKAWPKIAVLGDLHEPFGHNEVKADFVSFCEKHKPDHIIQIGDAMDFYSASKFPRSHNVFTPKQEEQSARKRLEELWTALGRAAPQSKRTMLLGNHDLRPLKRVLESVPAIEHWAEKYLSELLTFDGVNTIQDPREEFIIADIAFIHGYRAQLGAHRDYMLMNAASGHSHRGGVVFRNIHGTVRFELNAGYAGRPDSKGLSYTSQRMTDWTLGFGYIDEYGPRFIPFR